MEVKAVIDVRGLRRFQKGLLGHPLIDKALQKWGVTYNRFMIERFLKLSAGGGVWKGLRPATSIAKGHSQKLYEFGDLLDKLKATVNMKFQRGKLYMQAGVTDDAGNHPSGLSMQQLVEIHQLGLGRVPARTIVVRPPRPVIAEMTNDMQRATEKLADATRT